MSVPLIRRVSIYHTVYFPCRVRYRTEGFDNREFIIFVNEAGEPQSLDDFQSRFGLSDPQEPMRVLPGLWRKATQHEIENHLQIQNNSDSHANLTEGGKHD